MRKKETIMVLGDSGFIGGRLLEYLSNEKYNLFGSSRKKGLDLTDYRTVLEEFRRIRPNVILNFASHHGNVHYGIENPAIIVHDNLLMTLNIYKGVKESCPDARIVNPISNCTYPMDSEIQSEKRWWDGIPHSSTLSFASSRRMVYVISLAYSQQFQIKTTNIILPGIYGPGDHVDINRVHALDGMIIRMIEAKRNRQKEFKIWGTGTPVREWCFIEDLLRLLTELIGMDKNILFPVNIGQKNGYSIRETAEIILEVLNYNAKLVFDTQYQDGAVSKILDNNEFQKLFPDFEFTNIIDGIERTVDYYEKLL